MCNRYMKKIIKILLIIIAFVPVSSVFSQEVGTDEILRAKVIEILDEKSGVRENGSDFIMQELNREANTLGSKSLSSDTTRASVSLKVFIEQMREQVQNIE